LNNNKQLNNINVVSRTRLTCVQINCLRNFNDRFLFVIVVVTITIVVVALMSTLASISMFAFVLFILTFVSFVSFALFFACLLSITILFAFVVFLNSLLNYNIKRICELKKIKTKLTIYNSNLVLLLRICS